RWQPMYTRASVAMGYEFGVTPVQLAAAYAAIANDGVLLAPTLVREVRDPAGNLLYRHRPEPVRRVVTSEIAEQLRKFLRQAAWPSRTARRPGRARRWPPNRPRRRWWSRCPTAPRRRTLRPGRYPTWPGAQSARRRSRCTGEDSGSISRGSGECCGRFPRRGRT